MHQTLTAERNQVRMRRTPVTQCRGPLLSAPQIEDVLARFDHRAVRDTYMAVSAFYAGGFSVINFSDPADPKERGFYLPRKKGKIPDMWSAYWYNGRVYTNEHSSNLGLRVFRVKGLRKSNVKYFEGRLNPQTMSGLR